MSVHDLLEKSLEVSKGSSSKETSPSLNKHLPMVGVGGSSSESSQSLVDELFKDFISKKISKTNKSTANKDVSKPAKVDEISKLLDLEISSIQAQTKEPHNIKEKDALYNTKRKDVSDKDNSKSDSSSHQSSTVLFSTPNPTANIPLPPELSTSENGSSLSKNGSELIGGHKGDVSSILTSVSDSLISASVSAISPATPVNSTCTQVLSTTTTAASLGKKMMIPKQLGCMLSTESLSLIKSNEKIDRNGRVWEDGEVQSSHSEGSNKEESDSDVGGYPSDTGSINSEEEGWKSHSSSKHKKKHKHKHKKKKKKKSSKENDKDKNSDDEKTRRKEREGNQKEKFKEKSDVISNGKEIDRATSADKDDRKEEKVSKRDKHDVKERVKEKENDSENFKKDDKSSDKEKSDSKKKEKEKKRKRDRSRSRTPKRSRRSRSRSRSPKRRKSVSPRRSRYGEWDARSYSDDPKKLSKDHSSRSRSRSGSRGQSRRKRSTDRKRERSKEHEKDLRLQIDKAKLRKIAIANALNTMKTGQAVPVQLDVAAVKSGGKSVEELTDFCKRISEKEQEKLDNAVSDSSEEETVARSDDEEPLIHHPFKVKDTTSNIVMNIRNAKQIPVLTPSEKQAQQASLRLAYPVSSGTHHRASESEWVPVERTTVPATPTISKVTVSQASIEPQPETIKSIFPEQAETQKMDIGAIISERLQAVRKLQSNPYDVQALSSMHKAQEKASQWAQSKYLPGQFIGSTGAQVMSQEELMGDKRRQAWAKKSQFVSAAPVSGGIGMFLLQKMGWKQGEGLGKNHEGSLEPLQLDIKIDRKGLSTAADNPRARAQVANIPKAKDLSHKHPVSALMELCNKRRWGPPAFTIVSEDGPDHKKYFLFKVKVNNVEYQPAVPSSNKKSAKAQCAAVCLQEMGLLPRDAPVNY